MKQIKMSTSSIRQEAKDDDRSIPPIKEGDEEGEEEEVKDMRPTSSDGGLNIRRRITSTSSSGMVQAIDIQEGLPPPLERIESIFFESRPVISVNRSSDGASAANTAPVRTLNDQQGEFAGLTQLPPRREPNVPRIRLDKFLPYLRSQAMSYYKFVKESKYVTWRIVLVLLWFFSRIWWQILLGVFLSGFADGIICRGQSGKYIPEIKPDDNLRAMHGLIGAILGFSVAFRTNIAYGSFYEGRKLVGVLLCNIRDITLEVCSSLSKQGLSATASTCCAFKPSDASNEQTHKGTLAGKEEGVRQAGEKEKEEEQETEEEEIVAMVAEVRRMLNLIFAFIRQDVRESQYGFLPASDLEFIPFTSTNFYMDPVRPRLWDLLSNEELTQYANISVQLRPAVAIGHLRAYVESISKKTGETININGILQSVMTAHESMQRIRDTPVPYPFVYVLQITTFVFVFGTPFLYNSCTGSEDTFVGVQLLIIAYFGILAIGLEIENPFRFTFGGFNLELENYCRWAHDDSLELSNALVGDNKTFIPTYLSGFQEKNREGGRGEGGSRRDLGPTYSSATLLKQQDHKQ